jgi:hypothetical protein
VVRAEEDAVRVPLAFFRGEGTLSARGRLALPDDVGVVAEWHGAGRGRPVLRELAAADRAARRSAPPKQLDLSFTHLNSLDGRRNPRGSRFRLTDRCTVGQSAHAHHTGAYRRPPWRRGSYSSVSARLRVGRRAGCILHGQRLQGLSLRFRAVVARPATSERGSGWIRTTDLALMSRAPRCERRIAWARAVQKSPHKEGSGRRRLVGCPRVFSRSWTRGGPSARDRWSVAAACGRLDVGLGVRRATLP